MIASDKYLVARKKGFSLEEYLVLVSNKVPDDILRFENKHPKLKTDDCEFCITGLLFFRGSVSAYVNQDTYDKIVKACLDK
jgi:hypothetical protein